MINVQFTRYIIGLVDPPVRRLYCNEEDDPELADQIGEVEDAAFPEEAYLTNAEATGVLDEDWNGHKQGAWVVFGWPEQPDTVAVENN